MRIEQFKHIRKILCLAVMLVLCSQPAYAADNIDGPAGVLLLILFIGVPIAGFFWWLLATPKSLKEAQTREKNAVKEAASGTLGIVIVSFQLGHPSTYYHSDGSSFVYLAPGADSVGGWSCKIRIINSCSKTIKYCVFNTVAMNSVGDPALCQIKQTARHTLSGTGPVPRGEKGEWQWEHFCYSYDLNNLIIETIDVTYMDGTTECISGNKIVWRNT